MAGNADPKKDAVVGVALSGGGHRASAWGLGVMQALVDCGLGSKISSVVSVSGGSITNGVIADGVDLHSATRADLDAATEPLKRVIASDGLFPLGRYTKRFTTGLFLWLGLVLLMIVAVVCSALAMGRGHTSLWWALACVPGLALGAFAAPKVAAKLGGGGRMTAGLIVGLGAAFGLGGWLGAVATTNLGAGWALLVAAALVIATLVAGWLFLRVWAKRGAVTVTALDSTFFGGETKPLSQTGPDDSPPTVNHIFATADLEAGDSLYLAPRFVSSYQRGLTQPDGVTLAEAVQASAALPGAFPTSVLKLQTAFADGRRPEVADRPLYLSDGGVYDNMADQWDLGRRSRLKRWNEEQKEGIGDAPNLLVVANASPNLEWQDWTAQSILQSEVAALKRPQSIQYDQTTATRRRLLFKEFAAGLDGGEGQRGVLLMIDRSPFRPIDRVERGRSKEVQDRADEVQVKLGCKLECDCRSADAEASCKARASWDELVGLNKEVGTVLAPLGIVTTERLLIQARAVTLAYLYIFFGISPDGTCPEIEGPPVDVEIDLTDASTAEAAERVTSSSHT